MRKTYPVLLSTSPFGGVPHLRRLSWRNSDSRYGLYQGLGIACSTLPSWQRKVLNPTAAVFRVHWSYVLGVIATFNSLALGQAFIGLNLADLMTLFGGHGD